MEEYPIDEDDYSQLRNILVLKFYMPDYNYQSKPWIVPLRKHEDRSMRELVNTAKLDFLKYGLKPVGKICRKHVEMMRDGRITYDVKRTVMTQAELDRVMKRSRKVEHIRKGDGWHRWKRARG